MRSGVVGFITALVPWGIVLLSWLDIVCISCKGEASASLRGLWFGWGRVALGSSGQVLVGRAAPWWGAAGLGVSLPFLALVGWSEPSGLWPWLLLLAVSLGARWRWRAHLAALARWREERDQALRR